jgi:hypothetical protein
MTFTTHNARLIKPLPYQTVDGTSGEVPNGACLMEQAGEATVDIIWGSSGEHSVQLSVEAVKAAADSGSLVLLD